MKNDFDVETALIASIFSDIDVIFEVADAIEPHDFAHSGHGLIYNVLRDRILDDLPTDVVSVVADMKARDFLDKAGGEEAVKSILEAKTANSGSARHYGELIRSASKRRTVAKLCQVLMDQATTGVDLEESSAALSKAMMELSNSKSHFTLPLSQSADELRTRLHALRSGEIVIDLLASGFSDLDELMNGLRAGQLIIVGARPGMGKTAFALELALQVATNNGRRVLFFSLEMSSEELSERAVASGAQVNLSRLQTGELTDDEMARVDEVVLGLHNTDLMLFCDPMVKVTDIRLAALKEQAKGKLGLIIVDYLQLMGGDTKGRGAENRQQEVAEISRNLKLLARELEVPIMALSQLSRNLDARHDKRPQLSDLRDSGAIEQDADLVLFLYRDEVYDEKTENQGLAEVIVAKHRNGPTGKAILWFEPEYMRFGDLLPGIDVIPEGYRRESGESISESIDVDATL